LYIEIILVYHTYLIFTFQVLYYFYIVQIGEILFSIFLNELQQKRMLFSERVTNNYQYFYMLLSVCCSCWR